MQRELEVLSEQYSQKCLENAHLAQALEAERQALRQCQRENQELNAHNQVRRTGPPPRRLASPGCGQELPAAAGIEPLRLRSWPLALGSGGSEMSVPPPWLLGGTGPGLPSPRLGPCLNTSQSRPYPARI